MKVLKFFLALFAVIASIVLIGINVAFNIRDVSSKFLSEKNIKKVLKDVDVSTILKDENGNYTGALKDLEDEFSTNPEDKEIFDSIVNSEPVKEATEEILSGLSDYLFDETYEGDLINFDIDKFINDFESNLDDIEKELQEKGVDTSEVFSEENKKEMIKSLKDSAPEIKESIDEVNKTAKNDIDKGEFDKSILVIRTIYSKTVTVVFISIYLVCAVIILLHTKFSYRCLKFFGIPSLISGAMISSISFVFAIVKEALISTANVPDGIIDILSSNVKLISGRGSLFIVAGIILIIANIVLASRNKKNSVKTTNENLVTGE